MASTGKGGRVRSAVPLPDAQVLAPFKEVKMVEDGFEEWWETQIAGHEDWQVDEWNVHRKPLLQKGWHARDAEIAALKERIAELTAPNQAQIVFDPSTAKRAKPHFYTEPEEPCDECEDKDARIAELEAEVAAMDISLAEMDYEADHDT